MGRETAPLERNAAMHKALVGLLFGALLGAVDGASAWFYPDVRKEIVFIILASTGKGLVAGLITGFIARKLRSLPLGMAAGFVVAALVTAPFAIGKDPLTGKSYFWEIMIPGAICG